MIAFSSQPAFRRPMINREVSDMFIQQAPLPTYVFFIIPDNSRNVQLQFCYSRCIFSQILAQNTVNCPIWTKKGTSNMKTYEVIKEEYVPCTGNMLPDRREILELQLENPALYVQDQYRSERSVEFLATEHDGSLVIESLLEGGRKHRYIFSEV